MGKSFYKIMTTGSIGIYDENDIYHPKEFDEPYAIGYCETFDDAKAVMAKRSMREHDNCTELVYFKDEDHKITKRYRDYWPRKNKYGLEGDEEVFWITELEFIKP